jgi:hypothetical protein
MYALAVMLFRQLGLVLLLSTVQGLPTQWRTAIVKRSAADIATEYDFIVGKQLCIHDFVLC